MTIEFYVDPATDEPHILRHGVEEWEAEDILLDPVDVIPGRRNTLIAVGQTRNGRWLRVIYRQNPGQDGLLVITAYTPRPKLLRALRMRLRRNR